MPLRVRVPVKLAEPTWIKTQDLHYHACRWIEGDSDDHHGGFKPFALSPLARGDNNVDAFEIGLIDDVRVHQFVDRISRDEGRLLRFGASDGMIGLPEVIASATWKDLSDRAEPAAAWRVDYLTPVLSRNGSEDLVFPQPSLIVGLSKRWGSFSPQSLESGRLVPRLARLQARQFEGATATMSHSNKRRTGFVGQVEYATRERDVDLRRRVDTLFRFAEYAGVGTMTTFGFGVVAVDGVRR